MLKTAYQRVRDLAKPIAPVLAACGWFVLYGICQLLCLSANIFWFALGLAITFVVLNYEVTHPRVKPPEYITKDWPAKLDAMIFILMVIALAIIAGFHTQPVTSDNQKAIGNMLRLGPIMLVQTVVIAPTFEENIFRRCLVSFASTPKFIVSGILSTLLFVMMHLWGSPMMQPVLFMQYLVPAIGLFSSYTLTRDIRYSIALHACYNLIASLPLLF